MKENKSIILEEKREETKLDQESNIDVVGDDDEEEIDVEEEAEESDAAFSPRDRSDEVRYEAIEEEFDFSGEKIKPCYCVLPFVSDEEVEGMTKRNIAVSINYINDQFDEPEYAACMLVIVVCRNITSSRRSTARTRRVRW